MPSLPNHTLMQLSKVHCTATLNKDLVTHYTAVHCPVYQCNAILAAPRTVYQMALHCIICSALHNNSVTKEGGGVSNAQHLSPSCFSCQRPSTHLATATCHLDICLIAPSFSLSPDTCFLSTGSSRKNVKSNKIAKIDLFYV